MIFKATLDVFPNRTIRGFSRTLPRALGGREGLDRVVQATPHREFHLRKIPQNAKIERKIPILIYYFNYR